MREGVHSGCLNNVVRRFYCFISEFKVVILSKNYDGKKCFSLECNTFGNNSENCRDLSL